MIDKLKKIGVIIAIALLFGFFSYSLVDVFFPEPKYEYYCNVNYKPMMQLESGVVCPSLAPELQKKALDCQKEDATSVEVYDKNGCVIDYTCDYCSKEFNKADEKYRFYGFVLTSILGIVVILVGLFAKTTNEVIDWLYAGLIIGGLFSLFLATTNYYHLMDVKLRPLVLLAEIVIVVLVAFKTTKFSKNSKTEVKQT